MRLSAYPPCTPGSHHKSLHLSLRIVANFCRIFAEFCPNKSSVITLQQGHSETLQEWDEPGEREALQEHVTLESGHRGRLGEANEDVTMQGSHEKHLTMQGSHEEQLTMQGSQEEHLTMQGS